MILPIVSAIIGILAFPPGRLWFLGFLYLVPAFALLLKEKKFWRLFWGVFLFRMILQIGTVYFVLEPYLFISSALLFCGLPICFFFLRKILSRLTKERMEVVLLLSLPILWTFWEAVIANFSFVPSFVMMTGNILGSSGYLGLSVFGGMIGLTFFAVLINSVATFFVITSHNHLPQKIKYIFRAEGKSGFRTNLLIPGTLSLLLIGGWGLSEFELRKNAVNYQNLPHRLSVVAVSTNKRMTRDITLWGKNATPQIISDTLKPIIDELKGKKIDIVLVGQSMIEEEWGSEDEQAKSKFGVENQGVLIQAYRDFALEIDSNVAATFSDIQGGKRFKTTFLFGKSGEIIDLYNKSKLTIGSETWPFGNWRPFYYDLALRLSPLQDPELAIFDRKYEYSKGEKKILNLENAPFASLICLEIYDPYEVKNFKELGAAFISHTTNNEWIELEWVRNKYFAMTNNLRKIEAVWLKKTIVVSGLEERAGIITPDGQAQFVNYESPGKNFGIFWGEIRY